MATSKIEQLPKNLVKFTITVPVEELRPYLEAAAVQISEHSTIPGFRPGKAPFDVVKTRVGDIKLLEEALEKIVRKTYGDALTEHQVDTVGSPHIDVEKMVPNTDLVYTAEVARLPAVTRLADYAKVTVTGPKAEVTDKDMDQAVSDLLRMQTKEVRRAAGIEAGGTDKVVIAIDMKKAGVPVTFYTVKGGGHGGFKDPKVPEMTTASTPAPGNTPAPASTRPSMGDLAGSRPCPIGGP